MNDIFRVWLHQFVIVYLDDILIYSKTFSEHVVHVPAFLCRLLKYKLYVKRNLGLMSKKLSFLAYRIGPVGVVIVDGKVTGVTEWLGPTMVKELQGKSRVLRVTPAAKAAFICLNTLFTTSLC